MRTLFNRLIFIRMRRVFELLVVSLFLIIILTINSKWSSSIINDNNKHRHININNISVNSFLSQDQSLNQNHDTIIEKIITGQPNLAKYIHLDLKGAPPQPNKFYETFFNFIDQLNMSVKGIVIEYEDLLPLNGRFANATHRFGYKKSDIELIQTAAKSHRLEIIPLIQTFGHLEWLLKLREFELYRDELASPMVITPCLDLTYVLLEDLLQQTLDMHPNSNIIHIGCDEVTLTNSHPKCQEISMDVPERYINHVKRVVSIVQKIRPGIRILIWDDVIRSEQFINNEKLLNELKNLVEPVAWNYHPTFDDSYIYSPIWNIYSKLFSNTWAASAFKGGLSRLSMQTNTTHHVLNHHAWLQFMKLSTNQNNKSFSAIILTGWSRFDHFMPLCDLLPTAYQSLISSLYILTTGKSILHDYVNDCYELMNSIGKDSQLCQSLPGLSIWSGISSLSLSLSQIEDRLTFLHTVAPSYNRKHLFVRRYELDLRLNELEMLKNDLLTVTQLLNHHLSELYSLDVIDEWFDLYITPILGRINATLIEFSPVRNQTSWSRRPSISIKSKIIMQCILPQSQTTPEKCLSNPWHGKGFCEPNQYKSAIDRCEGGHKSCDLSIEIYKELVKVLEHCSESLHQWSLTSQRKIVQSKEFGTTRAAWIESIQAVEKLAERNEDITKNIQHHVIDKMVAYKNSKYERSFLHLKKVKEFEKDFKKVQKPWLELLNKINEAKQEFHHASRKLHHAKRAENVIKTDLGTTDEQKKKVKDSVHHYESETETCRSTYSKLMEDMKAKQPGYQEEMFKILSRTDDFERDRLNQFKLMFNALQEAISIENDARHTEMSDLFNKAIGKHNINSDIEYFNKHYGRETKTKWPVFEDVHESCHSL
ncbi:unnamed protein product [Rotaria sordida]|uniref:F-BAR domain-containing protein n=1 Tax=Rotaria sordida TaxID=392033 RepID=A0A813VV76_9BILA|nr:unnamed protein product [Rotaria sordida]